MEPFVSKLLDYYGLTSADYERLTRPVSVSDLPYPYAFFNFEPFIARIEKAITNGETILVYGDYDADGILATSILKYAFLKRGVEVFTMIPSRYKDGYGLSKKVLDRVFKRKIDLIITVDNGISAHEAVSYAKAQGIDVLVSDHHEIGETLPEATAILHPELSNLGTLNSCGAYMALVISYGILTYYDDYLITLAGIATIADMMPLVDRNRTVVKLALQNLNKFNYPALLKLNGSSLYSDKSLGMRIAPRINALGRLSQNYEANVLIEYFTTSDMRRIHEIATYVESVYEARKKLSTATPLTSAEEAFPAVVLISDELEGVLGLLAQSYVTNYQKPAIVFTESSEDAALLKGSARSGSGFHIVEAFNSLGDLIIQSGGHAEAGGLTIKKSDFPAFKEAFLALAALSPLQPKEEVFIPLMSNELKNENFNFVQNLGPFGVGFKAPLFMISDANAISLSFSRDQKHILTTLPTGVKLIGFNMNDLLRNREKYVFYGHFSESSFRNVTTNDFVISKIE